MQINPRKNKFSLQEVLARLRQIGVQDLSLNSQQLNSSTAFIAIQGSKHHGLEFLAQAMQAEVPCVLVDAADPELFSQHEKIILVEDLREHLGDFASAFYHHPSQYLKIHAVTGTNGKTSCSQFIAQALMLLGEKCAVIGTLGMGLWPNLKTIPNTTPDAITLQKFLAKCVAEGVQHISMEASSIAIDQNRLQGCYLDTAIFTNLTQDHLDYHGSMEAYGAAKQKLFTFPGLKYAIVNADDEFGKKLITSALAGAAKFESFSKSMVLSEAYTFSGIRTEIQTPQGQGELKSSLLGQFNLENLLAILTWMLAQNIPFEKALAILSQLKNPRGRMEVIRIPNKPLVVIDYAHTPDALEKALKALRTHCEGKLWCVFGCGGNRDKAKRPLMGKIALALADEVVLTSDNPRDEDPAAIIHDIAANSALKIPDRAAAIEYAMTHAAPKDIVLIAGKGHETYQEIQGKKYPFEDKTIVQRLYTSLT